MGDMARCICLTHHCVGVPLGTRRCVQANKSDHTTVSMHWQLQTYVYHIYCAISALLGVIPNTHKHEYKALLLCQQFRCFRAIFDQSYAIYVWGSTDAHICLCGKWQQTSISMLTFGTKHLYPIKHVFSNLLAAQLLWNGLISYLLCSLYEQNHNTIKHQSVQVVNLCNTC